MYITPEKLELFLPQLRRLHTHVREIGLLAVDEAHCISQWGHDFRVAYLEVGKFRLDSILSMVPIMALTATASQQVRLDINQRLNLAKCCKQFCTSVDRTNLHITVREIKAGGVNVNMQYVVDLLLADRAAQENGSTIIFVPTTSGVDKVADYLTRAFEMHGINVTSYHGKMSSEERASAHKEFLTGRCPVIVATVVSMASGTAS